MAEEHSSEMEDYLESIRSRSDSLTTIYHGTVKDEIIVSDWGLWVKSSHSNDARFMLLKNMTETDGQWCMNNLEKSYQSDDNMLETLLNENFRKSVSSKTFAMCEGVNTLLDRIKDETPIGSYLHPVMKPYKFNCHEEGYCCLPHKDTSYSSDDDGSVVGTLILVLCSAFEGGDLSFPVQDKNINLSADARSGCLQFVYFDTKYSPAVTLVEYGFRFSIVFNVYSPQHKFDHEPKLRMQIETNIVYDETKSFAQEIYQVFKNEKNILFYDNSFTHRLELELRRLFANSINVFFGNEHPELVYDCYDSSEDYYGEVDEYGEGDFLKCVDTANSYLVSYIIGKTSTLVPEQLTKKVKSDSPYSYCDIDYFRGVLLNPGDSCQSYDTHRT